MTETQTLLSELARAKAEFQLRAIIAAMGLQPDAAKPTPPTEPGPHNRRKAR